MEGRENVGDATGYATAITGPMPWHASRGVQCSQRLLSTMLSAPLWLARHVPYLGRWQERNKFVAWESTRRVRREGAGKAARDCAPPRRSPPVSFLSHRPFRIARITHSCVQACARACAREGVHASIRVANRAPVPMSRTNTMIGIWRRQRGRSVISGHIHVGVSTRMLEMGPAVNLLETLS